MNNLETCEETRDAARVRETEAASSNFENVFCIDLCQRAARFIYYSLARTCPLIREHQTGVLLAPHITT